MSLASLMDENGPSGSDLARWTGSLCLVLILHLGISLAILDNIEPPESPAERESVMMIDLPVEAILPEAESVASIATPEVAEVDTTEIVETREPVPEETAEVPVEMTEETPVEQVPEEKIEVTEEAPAVQALDEPAEVVREEKPTEISETAVVVAEIVPPEETVTAQPVETAKAEPVAKPQPKPKPAAEKKPKPAKQQASKANVNSKAAAGAGRANPNALKRYLSQVRASIMRHRRAVSGASGRVVVSVTIGRSGAFSGVRIAHSSGNGALDRVVLGIVRSVGRVAPIPAETGRSSIALAVPFAFKR